VDVPRQSSSSRHLAGGYSTLPGTPGLERQPSPQPTEERLGTTRRLPGQRVDAAGHPHVDHGALFALALRFMASSAVQVIFNVIDMWFVGRISTDALAAVGSVQWLMLAVIFVLGSGGSAVQAIVAQQFGAARYTRAAQTTWTALWATLWMLPIFLVIAGASRLILAPFGLETQVQNLASDFWFPRMLGIPFGSAGGAVLGYFNGIGRPGVTLWITAASAAINIFLNQLLIFDLHWGIAGSGWATTIAQAIALLIATAAFLNRERRRKYKSNLTWRPRAWLIWKQLRLGLSFGLLPAIEVLAFAVFQLMQVRSSSINGAATQLAVVLGSISYIPGSGISAAGMTWVGQSIGAGDSGWAMRVGTHAILLVSLCTGGIGLAFALLGPWILPLFVGGQSADSPALIAVAAHLLWFAAIYQFFDGLNIGSSTCLRAAGDATVPVLLSLPIQWVIFLPLAHSLTFAPGEGWLRFLPQFGWGAVGGWSAVLINVLLLGSTLFLRWQRGAWRDMRL
jgi:multidrug resistance protein, MATE family